MLKKLVLKYPNISNFTSCEDVGSVIGEKDFRHKDVHLLAFSGGMDSLACLFWALNLGYNVHAHHVFILNNGGGDIAARLQREAARNIATELYEMGKPIKYTESFHDFRNVYMLDSRRMSLILLEMVALFETHCHTMNQHYQKLYFGASEQPPRFSRVSFGWDKKVAALFGLFGIEEKYEFPIGQLSKRQLRDCLTDRLYNMSWSCLNPIVVRGVATNCGDGDSGCEQCRDCNEHDYSHQPKRKVPND